MTLTSEGPEQRAACRGASNRSAPVAGEGAGETEAEVMYISDGAEEARVAAARLICVPRDPEG